jgi:hypothetical protein
MKVVLPTLLAASGLLGLAPGAASAMDVLDLYGDLLARHTRAVDDPAGVRVDYAAIAADPSWRLLLASLAATPAPEASAPKAELLETWINAYNALAIDVVARAWPVASIRDIGSLLRPVWKHEAGRVGGRGVTLDEIEHGILRPLGDPRIHVAIVCASTSCPALAREPYRAAAIDSQLDAAAARFVADRAKGVRVEGRRVRLSRIFDWFAEDFAATGGVLAFVRRFAAPELAAALEALGPEPPLAWFDYDWSLNGLAPAVDDESSKLRLRAPEASRTGQPPS